MNTETFSSKSRSAKALIVIGFFASIALIAWLSVQIVAYTPSTFSSLASLSQGISQYKDAIMDDESLSITSGLSTIESGTPATISWEKDTRPGTYTFSYSCSDTINIEIVSPEGMRSVSCDMRYSLGDTDSVTLVADSTSTTSTNISYAISFMRENDIGPIRIGEQTLAVTPTKTLAQESKKDGETLGESTKIDTPKDAIVTPPPKPSAPVIVTKPEPELIYEIPVSNPNGFTDLTTRFVGSGSLVGSTFVAGSIERDKNGAIQFEVKNNGTKTSSSWSYTLTLPDGSTYTSLSQAGLKPNERATITIGFVAPEKASFTFIVVVNAHDETISNNSFKKVVSFTN